MPREARRGANTFQGSQSITGRLEAKRALRISGVITPAQIVANTNDYNVDKLWLVSRLRLSTDASRNITGLFGGYDGRIIIIHNVGSFDIVLKNQDANSTAANRFVFGADLTVGAEQSVALWYDGVTARWRLFSVGTPASSLYQPLDAELTALAALTSAADKLPYFTGSGTAALADLSAFIRTLLNDVDAATARTTIGAEASGTAAAAIVTHEAAGNPHPVYLTAAEGDAAYQPLSSNLTEYAAVNPTAAGLALLDDADAAAQRTTLGLGTLAVLNGASGVYTPTLTGVANVAASTAYECQYMQVGSTVTVSGRVDVDPTLTATSTELGVSLPVASNLGAAEDCAGVAFASGIAAQGAAIRGDAANNRAEMVWIAADVTNQPMYFVFSYQVI